jgi:predicted nucleotide-binding protein
MLCVPIITSDRATPFGVVSFHNGSAAQPFAEDARSFCETFVSVLALGLSGASERLNRRGVGHRRLFIGCASEDLAAARKIQSYLREVALVRIWNQGVFKAGGYILETLLRAVKEYDCAIFLLTPNDVVEFRGAQFLVARDNVLFEAGLFFSQLGRARTLLIVPEVRQLRLPSDLDGLIRLTYRPPENPGDLELALAPVCNDIIDILRQPLSPIV